MLFNAKAIQEEQLGRYGGYFFLEYLSKREGYSVTGVRTSLLRFRSPALFSLRHEDTNPGNVQNILQNYKLHGECHVKLDDGIGSWIKSRNGKNQKKGFTKKLSFANAIISMMPLNYVISYHMAREYKLKTKIQENPDIPYV